MNRCKIEQEIKERWFKNHVAQFERLNDRVSTLTWRAPNSSFYYVRYIFDGSKLYVSGDMGEAVFCLTEKTDINTIKDYNIHYFHSKMTAFCGGKYSFDSDEAIERLKEEIEEANENRDIDEDGVQEETEKNNHINSYISVINMLIKESKSCINKSGWEYEISQVYDELTDYDPDCSEWIFKAGDVIPNRVYGYLIGIKMSFEQLKEVL
ncbi:hypothetical protein [Clostridium hydrogeniformans]|uniref:hypothetical protein n=1 Tax=Clostridium hydrogeniformans TaxID=349933 RepID=UPI0004866585|nr:hypothetical protein [Clostridium hydrogeniformans]